MKTKYRRIISTILTILLVFGMSLNVCAEWVEYNSTYNAGNTQTGNVVLNETWYGNKQCINFWKNGEWVRNIAGEGHTLLINNQPILYDLYWTTYWCFDKYGNCFAINKDQRLLFCKSGSMGFLVESTIYGCTGFQRDEKRIGYLLYTNNGIYELEQLVNNGKFPKDSPKNNSQNSNNNSNKDNTKKYPYVEEDDGYYYYYTSANKYDKYYLNRNNLYYKGTNSKDVSILISSSVDDIIFWDEGCIMYALTSGKVYGIKLGKTAESKKVLIGSNFKDFDGNGYFSDGYYNSKDKYTTFSSQYDKKKSQYPYIEEDDGYYYYYTSANNYYKYYLNKKNLYYKGPNKSSTNVLISSSVDEITFWEEGYIAYALTSGKVYKAEIGKTGSSYKKLVGNNFGYFDEENYFSDGYYDEDEEFQDF